MDAIQSAYTVELSVKSLETAKDMIDKYQDRYGSVLKP